MTHLDEDLTPQPISGVDLRSLQTSPSPEDYFILSRVDGSTTIKNLCVSSGLGRQKTLDSLQKLLTLGLIQLPGAKSSDSRPTTPAGTQADDGDDQRLAAEIRSRFPADFATFPADSALMQQQIELDDDFKREILFVHGQLDQVSYYQLLGVAQDAPRRELRRAYFQMSKRYHPDRFFRKLLGDFQPPMEAIFQRITAAYQTLSHREKRRQYDDLLKDAQPTQPQARTTDERRKEMAFQLLYRRGNEAFEAGEIAQAALHFRKALTLKRDPALAIEIAHKLLSSPDHLDDAAAFANAAQKLDPQSAEACKTLGMIYEKKGQHEDARYHLERALKLAPHDGEAQQALARLRG